MMPRELGAGANQNRLLPPPDLDRVVGHETVAAHDEIECALTLADAALAHQEDAKAEDIHQHRVDHRPLRERVLEHRRQLRDGRRRGDGRLEERQARSFGLDHEFRWRRETACDQHTGEVERQREPECLGARRGVEALEIADLALAEDQDAARPEILVKSG